MVEKMILGIDIEAIMPFQEFRIKRQFKNQLSYWKRCINLLERENCIVYFFVPDGRTRENNELLNNTLIKYSQSPLITENKIVNYENDYYGAVREYRIDVLILPAAKLTDANNYIKDDVTIGLANHRKGSRDKYYLTDFLPDYTQVIAVQENHNQYRNTEKVDFVNDIYHAIGILSRVEERLKERKDKIFMSYQYVPKTGIVSVDQEWKPYWISSKFENNLYDKKYQELSRLDFLKYHNRFRKDKTAIKYVTDVFKVEITWQQVFELCNQCCRSFLALGLKKGDCVTTCMPNTIEDYILGLALNHIGVIVNPIHPLSTKDKIERYFANVHPKMFIGTNMPKKPDEIVIDLEPLMKKYEVQKALIMTLVEFAPLSIKGGYFIGNAIKKIRNKNSYENSMRYKLSHKDKIISFSDFLNLGKSYSELPAIKNAPNDTAYYYSTGGTTSDEPKIVIIPYSMINTVYYNSYGIQIEKGDAVLINYPRYIAFSDANCTHLPASVGMKMVFTPYEYPANCAQIFEKEKIAVLQVAPQFYEMMLEDESKGSFDKIDLSSIKILVGGGDKWEQNLKDRLREMLQRHGNTDAQFIVGYGNTEVNGSAFVQLFDTYQTRDDSSIGIPLPPFHIKLVDEDGNMVTDKKQRGRLYIGGTNACMKGYLNDPVSTDEVIVENNMYDTGDIIEFDKAPNYDAENVIGKFIAREKRFIMITQADRSGKVIPNDIEKEIISHIAEIKACCVVGVKEQNSMQLKAAIVLNEETEDILQVKEKIIEVSRKKDILNTISDVKFIDELPLTDRQKINYREVEKMFAKEADQ